MNDVKVTVLMPAYNAEKYIGDAIRSILMQTFIDFELLIINDGSTDKTNDVINSFSDIRIVLINQPNQGISKSLNIGLQRAKGEYIARFDADDICFAQRLEKQVIFLDAHRDYIVTGSDAEYILENGDHLFNFQCIGYAHEEIIQKLYRYCPFIHSSVMYRKDAVIRAGGYSVHAHNFEDYLLWTQLARSGKLCNLREPLIKVRFNPASVTIDEKWRGKRFRDLKRTIIERSAITSEEGNELLLIIRSQDVRKIKEGAYYAMCGKKFLADNYQPVKARRHVSKAIRINPLRWDNYLLFMISFFPGKFIKWLHLKSHDKH